MRERGQVCAICLIPLAPPHPYRERRCTKCDHPRRVFLHASHNEFWRVHFLEEDWQTQIGKMFTYTDLESVRDLLTRGNATGEAMSNFERSIRSWNIGACRLTLTPEQYQRLKTSR